MSDTPVPENPITDVIHTVTDDLLKAGEQAGETALKNAAPWLNIWPLSTLLGWLFDWLEGVEYKVIGTGETFLVIKLTEDGQVSGYNDAVKALVASLNGGDIAKLSQAQEDFEASLKKLGHWDGAGSLSS